MTTLADVRVIVYTLAGFGLIAFAFGSDFQQNQLETSGQPLYRSVHPFHDDAVHQLLYAG